MAVSEKRNDSPGSLTSSHSSKDEVTMVEAASANPNLGYDEKATGKLIRKIDFRLVSFHIETVGAER